MFDKRKRLHDIKNLLDKADLVSPQAEMGIVLRNDYQELAKAAEIAKKHNVIADYLPKIIMAQLDHPNSQGWFYDQIEDLHRHI